MVTVERTWTTVEELAFQRMLEHLGLSDTTLEDVEAFEEHIVEPPTNKGRTWTKAQRAAHSKRMKAFWRTRRRGK